MLKAGTAVPFAPELPCPMSFSLNQLGFHNLRPLIAPLILPSLEAPHAQGRQLSSQPCRRRFHLAFTGNLGAWDQGYPADFPNPALYQGQISAPSCPQAKLPLLLFCALGTSSLQHCHTVTKTMILSAAHLSPFWWLQEGSSVEILGLADPWPLSPLTVSSHHFSNSHPAHI